MGEMKKKDKFSFLRLPQKQKSLKTLGLSLGDYEYGR